MGLSTYLRATNYLSDAFDSNTYKAVRDALEDIVPLDIGLRHNASQNIEITIPIATWHRGHTIDGFLWDLANNPERDEFELDLTRQDIEDAILQARRIATNPELASELSYSGADDEEWVAGQFLRLERALTDFVLDDRLKNWTLKVWRSY
jgi:hypothetical protein